MDADVLRGVPTLSGTRIASGERWVYSAGCNVDADLASTGRIDTELRDLALLADAGARIAILSHQGSHRDGTAAHLDHIAAYLAGRLDRPVAYRPDNTTDAAVAASYDTAPGSLVLYGNTRHHAGEERGDRALAAAFARLGDRVCIGGFSKAHRAHASNTGLLDHLPGVAADSLVRDVRRLAPWSGLGSGDAVVLGGRKREKTVGLGRLTRTAGLVIPGGAVLNQLLAATGLDVGASDLGQEPRRSVDQARAVLSAMSADRVHLPVTVRIAPNGHPGAAVDAPATRPVPDGYAIVDFHLQDWAAAALADADRAVIAGPPGRVADGHRIAADAILGSRRDAADRTLLLGGDTVHDLPWAGPASTGGGSALHYLADGDLTVLARLRERRTRS